MEGINYEKEIIMYYHFADCSNGCLQPAHHKAM